jgi:tetratricopeptide (TPR) repeat protein
MPPPLDPEALYERVRSLRRQGRREEALRLAAEALAQARQGAGPAALAKVLCVYGQMERDRGRNAEAADCYREAAGLYRNLADTQGLAYAARHASDLERELGRLDEARTFADEGLAAYRALGGPPLDLANMLRVCALLKFDLGEAEACRQMATEASELYAAARIPEGAAEMQGLAGRAG